MPRVVNATQLQTGRGKVLVDSPAGHSIGHSVSCPQCGTNEARLLALIRGVGLDLRDLNGPGTLAMHSKPQCDQEVAVLPSESKVALGNGWATQGPQQSPHSSCVVNGEVHRAGGATSQNGPSKLCAA
eukprot:15457491-Alexandrium_andersonii.AAC.1